MERDGEKRSTRLNRELKSKRVRCDRKTKSGNWMEQQRKGRRHTNKVPLLLTY